MSTESVHDRREVQEDHLGGRAKGWQKSVFQTLAIATTRRLSSQLTSSAALNQLVLCHLRFQEGRPGSSENAEITIRSLVEAHSGVAADAVVALPNQFQRLSLIGAITIFDTFLTDFLRLHFLMQPHSLPKDKQVTIREVVDSASYEKLLDSIVARVVHEVAYKSYRARLEYLAKLTKVDLDPIADKIEALEKLALVRNELVHDAALYRYTRDTAYGNVGLEARPIPEVSFKDSIEGQMLVSEIADHIYYSIFKKRFKEEPELRPLTTAMREAHADFRARFAD